MKVLVVRFAAIGDCVITTWAVTAIRHAHPDSNIYWATQDRCAPVIDTEHLVDHLEVFPRDKWKANRWSMATWRDQYLRYTALRKERIDVGFDFQGHSKTALCLKLAACKERYASRATDALAARLNPPAQLSPEGPHEVQRAISLVRCKFDVALPTCTVMPGVYEDRARWEQTFKSRPVVTIQTGAGEKDKTYPVDQWDQVAGALLSEGIEVVALGGPRDPTLACKGVTDLVGSLSLQESLAVTASSRVHLSGDTGTAHAAAAYQVPTVTIFGRTDPDRFRPWGNRSMVLREGADTSQVSPLAVVEATKSLLEVRSHARPDL